MRFFFFFVVCAHASVSEMIIFVALKLIVCLSRRKVWGAGDEKNCLEVFFMHNPTRVKIMNRMSVVERKWPPHFIV